MATASRPRLLTIGTVCAMLKDEFPDISISKIRYLEDQRLLAPRRTEGGYRLFSEDDVERLETILRLQRDEFLPLRVIRQELASSGARALRACGDRQKAREGAGGVRLAGAAHRVRREALPRARCRHRARLRPAGAVRNRASASPRIPHGGGPRVRAHRAGRRACPSRPQSGAATGWDGGSRITRGARPDAWPAAFLARAPPACVNMTR